MEQTNWVLQINDELNSNAPSTIPEKEKWKRHSIYKIPSRVTELKKNAYKPKVVSFGPYHHGKDQLKGMEEHKHRALVHFLKRCNKPVELVFQRMELVWEELRDSYKSLDPIWIQDNAKFLKMMILDGCFMLEILRSSDCVPEEDYAKNDPVFSQHGKMYVVPYIKRDMLMLENQLPMRVLHTLLEVETGISQDDEFVNKQIQEFFNISALGIRPLGKCLHVLDAYRRSLFQKQNKRAQRPHAHWSVRVGKKIPFALQQNFMRQGSGSERAKRNACLTFHSKTASSDSQPWNMWRANLIHTYFRNPWALVSLIAGVFLFALTIIQTLYTVAQYYQPS